ncbi:MAG: UPF0280 family protein [Proteobacteria bacterium]|nr:UPF0280 family protein [Pseudomonadota bacterium]MBU1742728.1 UPF0280 family protein [Pseudomonadota bacterium]
MAGHEQRRYRRLVSTEGLVGFRVSVKESDLWIAAERDLTAEALEALRQRRRQLETYAARTPGFLDALTPLPPDPMAPEVVQLMIRAGARAGVGPMAAVAGAVAETVGRDLLPLSPRLIVENGGDVFISSDRTVTVALWAGASPLSGRLGLALPGSETPFAVCTSSGTVGHSTSFGRADAVTVWSPSAALADAVATAMGNRIKKAADLQPALQWGLGIEDVTGAVAVFREKLAAGGDVELVEL